MVVAAAAACIDTVAKLPDDDDDDDDDDDEHWGGGIIWSLPGAERESGEMQSKSSGKALLSKEPSKVLPPSGGVHSPGSSGGVVMVLVLVLMSRPESSVPAEDGQRCCGMYSKFGEQNISQVSCSEGGLISAGCTRLKGKLPIPVCRGLREFSSRTCIRPWLSRDGENSGMSKSAMFWKNDISSSSGGGGMWWYIDEGEGNEYTADSVASLGSVELWLPRYEDPSRSSSSSYSSGGG